MAHEKLLSEFVEKMRTAAGENLISVILYGSAAEGEFHPEYSDLNLLCVLRDTSFASLSKIASAVEWWRKKKDHPRYAARELASWLKLNSSAYVQLMDGRAKKSDRKHCRAMDVAGRYLSAIGTVTTAVDKMPGSAAPGRQ